MNLNIKICKLFILSMLLISPLNLECLFKNSFYFQTFLKQKTNVKQKIQEYYLTIKIALYMFTKYLW